MKNKVLILFIALFLSGCATNSHHLIASRVEPQEPEIGLSKQDPAASFHTAK